MKTALISIAMAAALAGCATGLQEDAGVPPPKAYRLVVAANFQEQFASRFDSSTLAISQPIAGSRDIVSGWRVCVRATPKSGGDAVPIAYFFLDGHIENVTEGDARCNAATFEPWTEMAHASGWRQP